MGGIYQPLSWLSYSVDFALWGLDARGFHAQSAFWHAVATGFLYLIARRVLRTPWTAAAAALFFALHPLRVESVAWASERRDVLCGALALGSVWAYLREREPDRPAGSLAPSLALFLLSLLAKGMSMTLPVALILLDRWTLRRRAYAEKLPYFALAAAFALAGLGAQERLRWSWEQHGLLARAGQAGYSLLWYLQKTLWPSGLAAYHELRPPLGPEYLLYTALALGAGVWLWRERERRPGLSSAAAAYAVMLAPVSGLFQFGPQLVADRYSYLPAAPLALLFGAAARRLTPGAGASILAALAVLTVLQQAHWKDSQAVWSRVLAVDPVSGAGQLAMGNLRASAGRLEEAKIHFKQAMAAFPGCAESEDAVFLARTPVCRKARGNHAAALAQGGDYEGAVRELRALDRLVPKEDEAIRLNLRRAESELAKRRAGARAPR